LGRQRHGGGAQAVGGLRIMDYFWKLLLANRQLVVYCLIGATTTVLDFCTFTLLLKYLGSARYQLANAAGYGAGTVVSFAANAAFNFCTRDRLAARFLTFCGVAFLGWLLSANVLALLIGKLGCNAYFSKLLALFGVVLLQYNLNRRFTFRKSN
jgi:putative flippase GtrA